MMNEYVVLANSVVDNDFGPAQWTVGTLEQARYWTEKWEKEGYTVNVRKCTHPLNIEFVKANINHKGEPM